MKQRYKDLTHELCVQAVLEGLDGKWLRRDVILLAEKYAGVQRKEIAAELQTGVWHVRLEAAKGIACEMEQRLQELLDGDADALDLDPVIERQRADGMTGKIRVISDLCVFHQLFDHLAKLALEPLFLARILPFQHASVPKRGPTRLKKQVERYLRSSKLKIRAAIKTDVHHAYGSLSYAKVIGLIESEVPSARWVLCLLRALARAAPGGHLIIGGYLDAWLFNYAMSYALRHTLSLHKERRGRAVPLVVRAETHMDDVALLGRRQADIERAARLMGDWMQRELGLVSKVTDRVQFMTVAEEHARRKAKTPAGRGCPGLDMGGYVMHRTYTTVRPRVWRRLRRVFLRARHEIGETGTLRAMRARRLAAYNGYLQQTDSHAAVKKYKTAETMKLAAYVVAYSIRKQRKERAA